MLSKPSGHQSGRASHEEYSDGSTFELEMSMSDPIPPSATTFPYTYYFDAPQPDQPPSGHSVLVEGWIIVPEGAMIDGFFVDHGARSSLARTDRPDVQDRFRTKSALGFRGLVTVTPESPETTWQLVVVVDGIEHRLPFAVAIDRAANGRFLADKAKKLERVRPLLRCPRPRVDLPERESCGGELESLDGMLRCERCGEQYPASARHFDFLNPELRSLGGVESTENISDFGYDPWSDEIIDAYPDGLVLDLGAGLKSQYLPNVVNFEIADYPTTDVLGIGEHLPFASGSFDGLLCLAVLEHVRDPFRAAAEIARVVRTGGRIYIAVPFLQPYHGYPHHYYNMTRRGLEQLFDDDFAIERSVVPAYGLPIWTLTWFLNSYVAGLPQRTAKKFREMKVKDLLGSAYEYLNEDFVGDVGEWTNTELACVNAIVATKR